VTTGKTFPVEDEIHSGDLPKGRDSRSAYQSTRRRLFSVEHQDDTALTAVLSNSLGFSKHLRGILNEVTSVRPLQVHHHSSIANDKRTVCMSVPTSSLDEKGRADWSN